MKLDELRRWLQGEKVSGLPDSWREKGKKQARQGVVDVLRAREVQLTDEMEGGVDPGFPVEEVECHHCNGSGRILLSRHRPSHLDQWSVCPTCRGRGIVLRPRPVSSVPGVKARRVGPPVFPHFNERAIWKSLLKIRFGDWTREFDCSHCSLDLTHKRGRLVFATGRLPAEESHLDFFGQLQNEISRPGNRIRIMKKTGGDDLLHGVRVESITEGKVLATETGGCFEKVYELDLIFEELETNVLT